MTPPPAPGGTDAAADAAASDAPPAPEAPRKAGFADSTHQIAQIAWPVFVGQIATLAYATLDTVLVARASAADLAALAVGSAAYVTVFIGFMGVVMALAPIVGQLHGAGRHADAGRQVHQALWIAIGLSVLGSTLLVFPGPFLAIAQAGPEVEEKIRGYLLALAFSLPASLLFSVYRGFNTAVSRPKAAMVLQLGGLALKMPLSVALVFGIPAIGLPALGVVGCGIATALAMWSQALVAAALVRRDPFYDRYAMTGRGVDRPDRSAIGHQLRLGIPMGAAILIEVTGFSSMALFVSRLGTTPVAGHQIAVNLVSLLFMVPMAWGNATMTLTAQRIGAGADAAARRLAGHGIVGGIAAATVIGVAVAAMREPVLRLYTADAAVIAAALPLVAWVAVFHVADASQTMAAFVLRAYKIAVVPVVIFVTALWGVGIGGGYALAFDVTGTVPPTLRGAPGFWFAATIGLVLAALLLGGYLAWVFRRQRHAQRDGAGAAAAAAPAP